MKLIPYVLSDGAYSLPDSVMKGIYSTMVRYHLDKIVFYSGGMNEDNFLLFMKSPQNVVHTIWEGDEIGIIAWVNGFGANFAYAHFCCFPRTWGSTSIELGRRSLEYWFNFKKDDGTYLFDVVLGLVPAHNKKAISYIKKVGASILGTIPRMKCGNKKDGVVVGYITREGNNGSIR